MTNTSVGLERQLPADRFHTGVRLVAMLAWFGSVAIMYFVLQAIARAVIGPVGGIGIFLLIVVALFLAQPLAWLAEKQLIRWWPSGRAVRLQPGRLTWQDKANAGQVDLGQKVNYWRWRFEIKRRRGGRVPTGHHCLAVRLVQGDTVLSLYSFISPAKAEALSSRYVFYELRRPNEAGKAPLGGRDAMYLAAEHARWDSGAELDPDDFEALLDHLAAHLTDFAATPEVKA